MTKQKLVQVAVKHQSGLVILKFDRDIDHLEMEPQNAINIAMAITDCAFEARDGVKPAGETLKAELVERHRMVLTQRIAMMLGTLREDRTKSNGYVAKELVEVALKEIF